MSLERISVAEFSPDDELFLFGDQTTYKVYENADPLFRHRHGPGAVFSKKHDLSYSWLAQHWQGEVPDEFFEDEAASRKWHEDIGEQVSVESGQGAKRERMVRDNPVASALYLEWLNDYAPRPIEERPVLSTALYFAYKALKGDAQRNAKLAYAIDLTVAADQIIRGYDTNLPQPLEGYADKPFPGHLLDN